MWNKKELFQTIEQIDMMPPFSTDSKYCFHYIGNSYITLDCFCAFYGVPLIFASILGIALFLGIVIFTIFKMIKKLPFLLFKKAFSQIYTFFLQKKILLRFLTGFPLCLVNNLIGFPLCLVKIW